MKKRKSKAHDDGMHRGVLLVALGAIVLIIASQFANSNIIANAGFDQYGYNNTARIFNGTGSSWCQAKGINDCRSALGGPFLNDKLVMKWTAEWDRGNLEEWKHPPYLGAWTDNEWNGKGATNGSGAVWHYKIIWVGADLKNSPYWRPGGYDIWGQFEVVMDQGTDKTGTVYPQCDANNGGHNICTLASPAGYGAK